MPSELLTGGDFSADERDALLRYKVDSAELNFALRTLDNLSQWQSEIQLLDDALTKKKSSKPVRLYRATDLSRISISGGSNMFSEVGFMSTALRIHRLGDHFRHQDNPVLLVIDCLQESAMTYLEFGNTGESEDEILLPRDSQFQVWKILQVDDQRKIQRATRTSSFYTQYWSVLHIYYTRLVIVQ